MIKGVRLIADACSEPPVFMLDTKNLIFPVCGEQLVITEGDGYSDKALLKKGKKFYEAVNDYLASLTVSMGGISKVTGEHISELLAPDHTFLQIECFKLNYGDFDFDHYCGECGKTSAQSVPLDTLEFRPVPPDLIGSDPTISIMLPRTKQKAVLGMLTAKKENMLIQQIVSTGVDLNQADFLSLRELGDDPDFSYEDVVKLPLKDHKTIRKTKKKFNCGYDTSIRITCPECGAVAVINLLTHRDFLLPTG